MGGEAIRFRLPVSPGGDPEQAVNRPVLCGESPTPI